MEWTQAHPEKRYSSVLEYSGIEILHFCADALANRARCGFAVSDPICDCTIPRHPSSPFIAYKGCPIFDGPGDLIFDLIGTNHLSYYEGRQLSAPELSLRTLMCGKASNFWSRTEN